MNRISLRTQLIIGFALLLGLTAVYLNIFMRRQIDEAVGGAYYDNFTETAELMAEEVGEAIYAQLDEGEWNDALDAQLDEQLEAFMQKHDTAVMLVDNEGYARIKHVPDALAEHYDEYGDDFSDHNEIIDPLTFGEIGRGHYDAIDSVGIIVGAFPDEVFGILRVSEDVSELDAQIVARQEQATVGIVTVSLMTLGILLFWLTRTLTKPLIQLKESAEQMANGDLTMRANTRAPGEISQLATSFNQMAEAVESMVAEQKAFASNAAHELRTPLTTIRLRTEALIEDEVSAEKAERYIQEVDAEARRLTQLVDDLRLLSQADAAQMTIGMERVDVGRLAQAIMRSLEPAAEEKGLRLNLLIDGDLPPIQAQMSHLRVVCRNLVENAIKYTNEGQIDWRLRVVNGENGQLEMVVRDTGVGIAAEHLPHLFKRFYRTDKARNRAVSGSGLGLSLVHSIVTLYSGDVSVYSDGVGLGTTARVLWPVGQKRTGEKLVS